MAVKSRSRSQDIYRSSVRHFLAPIVSLLDDEAVSEVMINGPEQVYYETNGRIHRADASFSSASSLLAAARNIAEYAGREIGDGRHSMDARLPDGSRVHAIIPPSSRQGVCITIRKFRKSSFDLDSLVEWHSITAEVAEFLRLVVLLRKNVVVSGGTGCGKTSLLNAMSAAIPAHERIVVIEDSSELQLHQPHTLYLEAQPPQLDGRGGVTIRDLFVDSLRMRPDRIVVGEVRRGEALDLIQSMLSGHAGSLTTVHASSARDAAIRLETLCLMSDVSLPIYVARAQVGAAVHLLVQISRMNDGSRRVIGVTECLGLDSDSNYIFQELYRFKARGRTEDGKLLGDLKSTGAQSTFAEELAQSGLLENVRLTAKLFGIGTENDDGDVAC